MHVQFSSKPFSANRKKRPDLTPKTPRSDSYLERNVLYLPIHWNPAVFSTSLTISSATRLISAPTAHRRERQSNASAGPVPTESGVPPQAACNRSIRLAGARGGDSDERHRNTCVEKFSRRSRARLHPNDSRGTAPCRDTCPALPPGSWPCRGTYPACETETSARNAARSGWPSLAED